MTSLVSCTSLVAAPTISSLISLPPMSHKLKSVQDREEATAIGNILMQMVATKEFESIEAGRQCILDSFTFSKHLPQTCDHEVLEKV